MAKISINTSGLSQNAKDISKRIDELTRLNAQLENLINQISVKWEGEACKAYVAMMQNYLKQAEGMVSVLQEFKKYAESVLDKFDKTDKKSAGRVNGAW